MYMSYCRFEGTLHELRACMATVEEHINGDDTSETSIDECTAFRRMVQEFAEFMYDMDLLDENGEIKDDKLDELCVALRTGGNDDE